MSEVKIARFVDIKACEHIFSEKSTFVLRSPEYYRRLYETSEGDEGDRNEGCVETPGRTSEFTDFVVSCWTKLNENEPTSDEWGIFKKKDQNIVAIVSTPRKVCEFLDKLLETDREEGRRFPFHPVEHDKVNYDPEKAPPTDRTNITVVPPFTKGAEFMKEKEYRFVLKYAWTYSIDSFIFCGGVDYMEKCFANPEMCKEQKKELDLIIKKAQDGYGDFRNKERSDIIANANILFD